MDNLQHQIRASGDYATYRGRDYFALVRRDRVYLYSDDDPLPPNFRMSTKSWVRGEATVPIDDVSRMERVLTTAVWRGHSFRIGIIVNAIAQVFYLGMDFDEVSGLPGMERPDKFEVIGEIAPDQLTNVQEHVEDVSPVHNPTGREDELR